MNRFDFEYDTSIIDVDGKFFRVLVVAHDVTDFELWDTRIGIYVNFRALPIRDQDEIRFRIAKKIKEQFAMRNEPVGLELAADQRAQVREFNQMRNVK